MVLLLICACGAGALAWYVKADPEAAHVSKVLKTAVDAGPDTTVVVHHRRHQTEAATDDSQNDPGTPDQVQVPEMKDQDVTLKSEKTDVPSGEDPKKFIAEEVVKDVSLENVRVHGVDVHNGVAVINFAGDIDAGMGSEQEAHFLKELQKGFGQFPEVRRIEIDKDGEPLEELGHIDLSDPLPVIRPGESDSDQGSPSAQGPDAMPLE